ncbi:MAG TPA: ABC transporter substrate-binding protein [Trebonia sp.]|nr:ABC transporter substrate-binding protein [Trebonia sp.]
MLAAAVTVTAVVLAACSPVGGGSGGAAATTGAAQPPRSGGTLNYLVSGLLSEWDLGLDPATGGAAPALYEDAVFGDLFRLTPSGGVEADLASGYTVTGGGTVLTITLRPGLKFSDGTPLNAAAVAWNIRRDLATPSTASPLGSWPPLAKANGITTPGSLTVVLHFTAPYAPLIATLIGSNVNHIASPTAFARLGAKQFQKFPVGAGPFIMQSNQVDHQMTMTKNPHYFVKGEPYLDKLEFTTVSDDQTAMESLQSGEAQATQVTTPTIIEQAKGNSKFTTTVFPGSTPTLIQLNTSAPPFSSKLAREAIYYATDAAAIAQHLYGGMFPTSESFLGPGDLFYQKTVPGYQGYDLAKAKQIVSGLGGLSISLFGPNDPLSSETLEALAQMWAPAGIKATVHPYSLEGQIQAFNKPWQAALQSNGAWDPGISDGLPFRFLSTAEFSGVHDKALDAMMAKANATLNTAQRAADYHSIAQYISSQAYAPFLVAVAPASVAASNVHGPGLSTAIPIISTVIGPYWDQAWIGS